MLYFLVIGSVTTRYLDIDAEIAILSLILCAKELLLAHWLSTCRRQITTTKCTLRKTTKSNAAAPFLKDYHFTADTVTEPLYVTYVL